MSGASVLTVSWIIWGAVTGVFVLLMIWKSLAGFKEDNVVLLDPAQDRQAAEQRVIVARVERVTLWAKRFGYASLTLLALVGGVWAYRGYIVFTGGQIP
jgi:hypothetical protein